MLKLSSFILFIILSVSVFAQEDNHRVEVIRDLQGLNTRSNEFSLKPNDAIFLHNVDLGRNLGSYTKRYGFRKYLDVSGIDSIIAIDAIEYSDNADELLMVIDPAAEEFGYILRDTIRQSLLTRTDTVRLVKTDTLQWQGQTSLGLTDGYRLQVHYPLCREAYKGQSGSCSTTVNQGVDYINLDEDEFILAFLTDTLKRSIDSLTGVTATMDTTNALSNGVAYVYIEYDTTGAKQDCRISNSTNGLIVEQATYWEGTGAYALGLDTLYKYFSIQSKPSFAKLNDKVFMANGEQKMVVWDRDVVKRFPVDATDEALFVPYEADSGLAKGEYRYAIRIRGEIYIDPDLDTVYSGLSGLSDPVKIKSDSGRVYISDIESVYCVDSLSFGFTAVDGNHILLYRTLANPGRIGTEDSLYLIDSVLLPSVVTSFSDSIIIDSLSDATLITNGAVLPALDVEKIGRDSTGALGRRYGAPVYHSGNDCPSCYGHTWIEIDTFQVDWNDTLIDTTFFEDTAKYGIYHGWPVEQPDTLGVVYMTTIYDSVSNTESDSSRTLWVWNNCCGTADTIMAYSYTIGMPRLPDERDNLAFHLYRAPILSMTHDSTFWENTTYYYNPLYQGIAPPVTRANRKDVLIADSLIGVGIPPAEFRLVSIVNKDSTRYTDSLRHDSLATPAHRTYHRNFIPNNLDNIFSFQERLWGTSNGRLWFSDIDSLHQWGVFNNIAINPDDGDEITSIYPSRGVIRVHKNKTNYNVYKGSNGFWNQSEVSGHFGSIAKYSDASSLYGTYYLTGEGVIKEAEGNFLERKNDISLLSNNIINLDNLSLSDRKDAIGFAFDNKYMLSVPAVGTTYVYDELADGWSTWDLYFSNASERNDTMFFSVPGSRAIYTYKTAEVDAGIVYTDPDKKKTLPTEYPLDGDYVTTLDATIVELYEMDMVIRMAPLFHYGRYKNISSIGLWRSGDMFLPWESVFMGVRSEDGSLLASRTYNRLYDRYSRLSFSHNYSLTPSIEILKSSVYSTWGNLVIDGFDIYYDILNETEVE